MNACVCVCVQLLRAAGVWRAFQEMEWCRGWKGKEREQRKRGFKGILRHVKVAPAEGHRYLLLGTCH